MQHVHVELLRAGGQHTLPANDVGERPAPDRPIVDPTDLAGEAAPARAPEAPGDGLAPRRPAAPREAVTMGEPADRLDDTRHNTAQNREGVPVMLAIGERSQSPTEVYVDGGAGVLHLRAGVRR